MGVDQEKLLLIPMEKTDQLDLPEDYTVVPAVVLQKERQLCQNHVIQYIQFKEF